MKCKNCNNLYNLTDIKGEIVGRCCPKINDSVDIEIDRECDKYEGMSNADRIRNMTDEELAEFIEGLSDHCLAGIGEVDCSKQITCENCKITALTWLQKEVE